MAKKPLPTPEHLRQLLRYEATSGRIFRTHACGYPDNLALSSVSKSGHHYGYIGGIRLSAHRVAFALYHGRWPNGSIDHIDGDPSNNAIDNLRECSHAENMCNRKPARSSTSRFLGVSYESRRKKWRAEIRKHGKTHKLGTFTCEVTAAHAYDEAAKELHGCFARLNFS